VEDVVRGIVTATGAALNAAQRSLEAYGSGLESLVRGRCATPPGR
jgi:hypothetical protein